MDERRLIVRLVNRWEAARGKARMPTLEAFDDTSIKDVWSQCIVVNVEDRERGDLMYQRMGEQVVAAGGADLTGKPVDKSGQGFPAEIILDKLYAVCEELRPIEGVGQFIDIKGAPIRWRACFLPFGEKKNQLSQIMVGLSFKR